MEYKRLRRNVIYLVIIGIILLIIQFITIPLGIQYGLDTSYPQAEYGADIMIFWSWFGVIETSVFFIIIPIKYLTIKRKKSPEKNLGLQKSEIERKDFCKSCGTEILDKAGEFCSKCGAPLK